MIYLKLFFVTLAVLLITDMVWLGLIAKNLYFKTYGDWLNIQNGQLQPVWWAAALVYFFLVMSILIFVLPLANGSLVSALIYGAIMGAITYGVYDFTCLAIYKNWPIGMSFVDWIWGTFLCAFSSMVTVYFSRLL